LYFIPDVGFVPACDSDFCTSKIMS
jgi:hypothetical protein